MNGYESDLETLVEMLESDESDESDEMVERSTLRRRPPRTAGGRNLYSPRPSSNNVTQAQLAAALAKVGEQIRTNSNAIATLNTRVETVATEQAKQNAAIRKEIADRRKTDDTLGRNIKQKLELLTILPLLLRPPSKEVKVHTLDGEGTENVKVLIESDNTLNALLPLLLIGGLGGGGGLGGSGSSDGGSDNNTMLLLVLALSGGLSGSRS